MNLENLKYLSILYDDDEILRNSTQNILSTLFKNVFVAKDGERAIKIYDTNNINILMLNIKMKNMSGIDVAKYIRAIDSKIPIFLVSSYTDVEDMLDAIKLDLVDYLKKPFSFEEVLNTLIRCLSKIDSKYLIKNNLGENAFYDFLSKQLISNGEYITLTKLK